MPQILSPKTAAPDFTLPVSLDKKLSLSELRGKPVILAFYPADWSPVCGDQMALYNEILPEFKNHNATLLGISVDGVWCHEAFAKDRHLAFPCWRISSLKARPRRNLEFIGDLTAFPSARCL